MRLPPGDTVTARLCLALCLLIGCAATTHAAPADAVAMVLADTAGGRSSLGAGFFITADGRLLTCYHVVAGASKIRVITNQHWTAQVVVQAIAPSRNLAVLRVTGMRARPPFIPLAPDTVASAQPDAPLEVYGYATSLDERAPRLVRATPAASVKSSAPRHPDTRRPLFVPADVDLIPLDATPGRGLCGAPVVAHGAAVGMALGSVSSSGVTSSGVTSSGVTSSGVTSGSVTSGGVVPGRSATWAVPVKYAAALTSIERAPWRIETWPPAALMSAAWNGPGRRTTLGPSLLDALDGFGRLLDARAALQVEALNELTLSGNQAMESYGRAVDLALFRNGARFRIEDINAESEADIVRTVSAYGKRAGYYDARLDALDQAGVVGTLTRELERYFARLPQSPGNAALKAATFDLLRQGLAGADAIDEQLAARARVFDKLTDSFGRAEVLEDLRQGHEQAALAYRALLQQTERVAEGPSRMTVARGVVELLFEAR